jgi:MFS family permease
VHSLPTLLGFALLTTSGVRIFWASFPTWVAELAPDARQRDRWFALTGAAQNAGLGLGGLIAGILVGIGGHSVYRGLIAANAVSFLIAAFIFLTQSKDAHVAHAVHEESGGYRELLRDRPFVAFMVASTIYALCCMVITIALPIYVVEVLELSGWVVGALFALNTAMLALGSPIAIRWLMRYRRTRALVLASFVWILASGLLALALEVPRSFVVVYIFVAVMIYSAGEMVFAPIATALCSEAGPERLRGRYMATFSLGWGLAASLAPSFFTALFAIRSGAPWFAVGALSLIAAAIVLSVEAKLPARAVRLATSREAHEPLAASR